MRIDTPDNATRHENGIVEPLAGDRVDPFGNHFTWGPIAQVHSIAEYVIVEYLNDMSSYSAGHDDFSTHGQPRFHPWVRGRDTSHSFTTLDAALAYCIAFKHEGLNTRASSYFMKMLTSDPAARPETLTITPVTAPVEAPEGALETGTPVWVDVFANHRDPAPIARLSGAVERYVTVNRSVHTVVQLDDPLWGRDSVTVDPDRVVAI